MAGDGGLRELVDEAGFTHRELARWVNALAERRGQHLGCTHTSVARWLAGAQPRWPIPALLTEAISRKLGYEVTISDLGLKDRRPPAADPADGLGVARTVAAARQAATELSGRDMKRRNFLLGSTFNATAFAEPALHWAMFGQDPKVAHTGGTQVRQADVDRIRQTVRAFRQLDRDQGGGELRDTVVRHLAGVTRTKLAGSYTESVGRSLFSAVAELTELAGWLSFDSGRHALAQRYHIQALRLAQAGDDQCYGANVLANMACQAVYLGHGWEAVQLARAARSGPVGRSLPPRVTALVLAMEARGHAKLRDEVACGKALYQAERALDATRDGAGPAWAEYFDRAELLHEFAHCNRDLGRPTQTQRYAAASIKRRSDGYSRRRAQDMLFLAGAYVDQRDLEAACATAYDALGVATSVSSIQCADYVQDFRRRLEPYAHEPIVRDFSAQAAELFASVNAG